jgi:hypothetical protein
VRRLLMALVFVLPLGFAALPLVSVLTMEQAAVEAELERALTPTQGRPAGEVASGTIRGAGTAPDSYGMRMGGERDGAGCDRGSGASSGT